MRGRLALFGALLLAPAANALGADDPDATAAGSRRESVVHARPSRDDAADIVITRRELRERGADNLAQALDLLPGVTLRPSGRGEVRVDLPGSRQTSVLVLVDGVPVNEPYFGTFDLAAIPVADIVAIRVSTAPASPLDGPGGDGAVVSVETLRATGDRRIDVRARGGTLPDLLVSTTGRTPLVGALSMRASGGMRWSAATYPALAGDHAAVELTDRQVQGHAALRLEYDHRLGHLTGDVFYQHRRYTAPPTDDAGAPVLVVPAEELVRAVAGLDGRWAGWRLAAGVYSQVVVRASDFYSDATLASRTSHDDTRSDRTGVAVHAERSIGAIARVSTRASLDDEGTTITPLGRSRIDGRQTYVSAAAGARGAWRWLVAEAALGLVAPLGGGAAPWPEAHLVVTITPNPIASLRLAGARKGRTATLREQFEPNAGNQGLAPEQTTYAEAQVNARVAGWVDARVAGTFRLVQGLIRLDATRTRYVNLDEIRMLGLQAIIEIARGRWLGGGAAYTFGDADSDTLGPEPLLNFPAHRVEAWLQARWPGRGGGFLRLRHVGERLDRDLALAPYTVVDVTGWIRLGDHVTATARVTNLLDERYAVRAGQPALPITASLALEGVFP